MAQQSGDSKNIGIVAVGFAGCLIIFLAAAGGLAYVASQKLFNKTPETPAQTQPDQPGTEPPPAPPPPPPPRDRALTFNISNKTGENLREFLLDYVEGELRQASLLSGGSIVQTASFTRERALRIEYTNARGERVKQYLENFRAAPDKHGGTLWVTILPRRQIDVKFKP